MPTAAQRRVPGPRRRLVFKIASEAAEFEQIFRLNYRTFVEEIPQHPPNPERRLIDRFHHQNTYLIALEGERLVGMIAVRGQRPFSLDEKLGDIDRYLPPGREVCELRLLSVVPSHRHGGVFRGLLQLLWHQPYDLAVISGTVRQARLYRHLGFTPFAHPVGPPEARYQPMLLTREGFAGRAGDLLDDRPRPEPARGAVSFLPGPVNLRPEVRQAFEQAPVSHRSDRFKRELRRVREDLCRLTGAGHCQILVGSGTLANDLVAAQLSLLPGSGLVLANGEFGERLIDHARRLGLRCGALERPWGETFDLGEVEELLTAAADPSWLWVAACETSVGLFNDVEGLKELGAARGVRLCLDAVSWLGTAPLDLRGVYLATGVSGKGLGSFAGLSMVFHHHDPAPRPDRLPRYLDLGTWAANDGVPFTHSSNLVAALGAALRRFAAPQPFAATAELAAWLRPRLRELGFEIPAPDEHASPAVINLVPPSGVDAGRLGDHLAEAGLLVSYQSEYLRRRNWLQICLMGECSRERLTVLLEALRRFVAEPAPAAPLPVGGRGA